MPGGFLQLLATGTESEYLNDVPNISFFKCYFRRHTNFFINNLEIYGNYYEKSNINTFLIPKSGDLLSKGYLKFNFDENYIEILGDYNNLVSTLTTDITTFMDSYNVYVNNFNKNDIYEIKNVKFILSDEKNTYLSLMSTYITNAINLIFKIKFDKLITLEKDQNNIFYNINQPYFFYGFTYEINYNFLYKNMNEQYNILNLLTENTNYESFRYFRLDISDLNIAFKFTFDDFIIYKNLFYYCLENLDSSVFYNIIKINQYDVYISLKFNLNNNSGITKLTNVVNYIKNFFIDYTGIKAKYYTNKIKYSELLIKNNELNSFVNNMFGKEYINIINNNNTDKKLNIDAKQYDTNTINNYLYYNIIFPSKKLYNFETEELNSIHSKKSNYIEMDIFNLNENLIFGNLDTNDFNESLINNETSFLNVSNINSSYSLCIFTFIKLIIKIISKNTINPSIQEFLSIINNPKTSLSSFIKKYISNTSDFNKIILDTIIYNNVLFLNKSSIRSIVYQNVSFNNYKVFVEQFVNKKISSYESIIINNYIFNNIFGNINSNVYGAFDISKVLIQTIMLSNYTNLNFSDTYSINFFYTNLLNYNNNNNVFNTVLYNYFPGYEFNLPVSGFFILEEIYKNLENFLYYTIYLTQLIINSNITIFNIYNKKSNVIYSSNGLVLQVINENKLNNLIFPLSSSFFFYTKNTIENSNNSNDYNIFYNMPKNYYQQKLKDAIFDLYKDDYQHFNINLNNTITNFDEIYNYLNDIYIENIVKNYYEESAKNLNSVDYSKITDFIETINNTNSQMIYNTILEIDYDLLKYFFQIVDLRLFNYSFSNYEINYPCTNDFYFINNQNNYLKFLFLPNSPYYRLYYLYNFLCTMTNDKLLISQMPNDLIQLRDLILLLLINLVNKYEFCDINSYSAPYKYFNYNFNNFDINTFFLFNTSIDGHFISYDDINVLFDEKIKETFRNSGLIKQVYIYSPFYFLINNINIVEDSSNVFNTSNQGIGVNSGFDVSLLLLNLYNNIKYNFDDIVIYAFIITIKINEQYFKNFNNIINFVNLFFSKEDIVFKNCVDILNKIIVSNNSNNNINTSYNYNQFFINPIYYNTYYTSYSIGTMFDNSNDLIINTINDLYSIPNQLTTIDIYTKFYANKSYDIKAYQNILTYEQISNGFTYFKKLLFNVNDNKSDNSFVYYQNLTNGIIKYIFDNFSYLINYLVSDFVFTKLIIIFDEYLSLYNSKNNTDVSLYDYIDTIFNIKTNFSNKKFQTNSIVVIYLIFYLFVIICLNNDLNKYAFENSSSYKNFYDYVLSKYSQNIYLNLLEDVILAINEGTNKLIFNYSTIYIQNILNSSTINTSLFNTSSFSNQPYLYNVILNTNTTFNNSNLFENKINNFDSVNINPNELIIPVFYNQYNINDVVSWNQLNNNTFLSNSQFIFSIKQISYNNQFYSKYYDTITSILAQSKKLFFISNNKFFLNYITSNNLVSNDLFSNYANYLNTTYSQNLYLIKNIYTNLQKSFQYIDINNFYNYDNQIINQIFNIINKFYDNSNIEKTYTYTLFFSNSNKIINYNTDLTNIINYNLYDITSYKPTINDFIYLRDFVIKYLDSRIISSVNIEKSINRYLYISINKYILKINKYNQSIVNYMNDNTLYDYVKLYNNRYLKTDNKVYEKNLSLYQNDIVYEILNFKNYSDKICFLQNPIFNDFIVNFSLYPGDENSFYINFKRFISFLKDYNHSNLFNKFKLSNKKNVIEYFLDVTNFEDMNDYIFRFINLTESFSPISIYENIISLKEEYKNNSMSSKINIDFDNIMKKIVIYLYIIYLINANMFKLINKNIKNKILTNHSLEYNFPFLQTNINLNDVFDNLFYKKLKRYIYYITVFDKNYPSKYNHKYKKYNNFIDPVLIQKIEADSNNNFFNNENNYEDFFEPPYFYDIKNNTNVFDFINLCIKYVSSYEETIGFSDIDTNLVIVQPEPNNITLSKLIQSYNVMINLDQMLNNTNLYYVTNSVLINISSLYDPVIKNINYENNLQKNTSEFFISQNKYYTYAPIKNCNIFFILLVKLLNKYGIIYSTQSNDLDNVLANFWIGTFNLSEIFEQLKGYTSDDYIRNNTINFIETKNINNREINTNDINIRYIFSRSQNVADLSVLTYEINNYSNVIPTDYDYDLINFNMKSIYTEGIDIYKKYYSNDYNFYNFNKNYEIIYKSKYEYYTKIQKNNYALFNIIKVDNTLFNKIFKDIIYTWLTIPFLIFKDNTNIFIENFNYLIKMYMKYYYSFKFNKSVSDVENLKIQNQLRLISTLNMDLNEISYNIKQLYYYELFGQLNTDIPSGTVRDNFVSFFNIIEFTGNYNTEYDYPINNFVLTVENSMTLIQWYLQKFLNIKKNDNNVSNILIENLINELSSYSNISNYFKNSYLYFKNFTTQLLFYQIVNTINYQDFIDRFSKVIKQVIYYTNNISWKVNLKNLYIEYFKDISFFYKEYVENDYIIKEYIISLDDLEQYILLYGNYMLDNTKDTKHFLFYEIFTNIVKNTLQNVDISKLNILYKWIFNLNKNFTDYENLLNETVFNLFNTLSGLKKYYGIVYSVYNDVFINYSLNFKLLLINYTVMKINDPSLTIDYIYEVNYKLEILYILEIFLIYVQNLSDSLFQRNFLFTITNCNKYLYDDEIFLCVNLENDICSYLDFINNNIISKNLISNYYKTIQNNTIKTINYYKINSFYNYDTNMSFLKNIYNSLTTNYQKQNETKIISDFIQNSIINIFNQYNIITENYSIYKNDIKYMENAFNAIMKNLSLSLDIPKLIFGGTNKKNTSIHVSINQLLNIFSQKNYKYDNNVITIFTLIYDNFNNFGFEKVNYNMIITYFYYTCMIIYILNKWDTIFKQYLFNDHEKIIYELINYINIQIYNFIYLINPIKTNEFFDGLNELLFNIYNNDVFTDKIIKFFDSIIFVNEIYKKERMEIIKNNITIKTFTGGNFKIKSSYLENMIYKKYVPYNKILIWKNMLVNIVDANISNPIYYMKSLMYDTLFDIPNLYLGQIIKISDGIFSNDGIINLINNLELYISDELIDNINNVMLIIIKNIMTNLNLLDTLNQMLGINNTFEFIKSGPIKPYILKSYKNKSLYLPLNFFFKDWMNSLPLISCMYSDILIRINNSNKTLIKDFYNLKFLYLPNKRIKTSMLLDFILLERTERKRLTLNKQDNLIEKHNYYTISQNINNQINAQSEFMYINFDFNITGLIKEIFWTIDFLINGYLIENINYNGENIFNMILSTVFYLDGIKRDGILPISTKNITSNYNNKPNPNNPGDAVNTTSNNLTTYNYSNITKLINPYKYNTRANIDDNINVYSFAFDPEKFQPTGAINMDMYNTFRIQLVVDKNKFLKYFGIFDTSTNLDSIMMTLNLTTLEYNLVRYQSGLGGLLFMK